MAPYLAPHAHTTSQVGSYSAQAGSHLVFVPVSGQLVFSVCVLLAVANLVWLVVLLKKGVEHDKES